MTIVALILVALVVAATAAQQHRQAQQHQQHHLDPYSAFYQGQLDPRWLWEQHQMAAQLAGQQQRLTQQRQMFVLPRVDLPGPNVEYTTDGRLSVPINPNVQPLLPEPMHPAPSRPYPAPRPAPLPNNILGPATLDFEQPAGPATIQIQPERPVINVLPPRVNSAGVPQRPSWPRPQQPIVSPPVRVAPAPTHVHPRPSLPRRPVDVLPPPINIPQPVPQVVVPASVPDIPTEVHVRPARPVVPPRTATRGDNTLRSGTNFCDHTVDQLTQRGMVKVTYFIGGTDCSDTFYQCSNNETFPQKCQGDQVFDVRMGICNHRRNVEGCSEFNPVLSCHVRPVCEAQGQTTCCADQTCMPFTRKCDGVQDCSDGEDETNCQVCAPDEWPCMKSSRCIPIGDRCNGVADDCRDGSNLDEFGCAGCVDAFPCYRSSNSTQGATCLDYNRRCDGNKDCRHGEDELNCKAIGSKFLLCENQVQSVKKTDWCNGSDDCIDGSDEKYCF